MMPRRSKGSDDTWRATDTHRVEKYDLIYAIYRLIIVVVVNSDENARSNYNPVPDFADVPYRTYAENTISRLLTW